MPPAATMIPMISISERFAELRKRGEKALVLFVTAGDPDLAELPAILDALQAGGADLIEIGIPFSDPIADGPTIQASSQRALDRGVTPGAVLDTLATWSGNVPIVLMGYLNPILRVGYDAFAKLARASGASGTIVSDLTPEESDEWKAASDRAGLDTIFLAAPTSTDERLKVVAEKSSGFVYAISRTGVTGSRSAVPPEALDLVSRLRERTDLPVCVGFGISTADQVAALCQVADGVVIGSWLVDVLNRDWNGGEGRGRLIEQVQSLKSATRA